MNRVTLDPIEFDFVTMLADDPAPRNDGLAGLSIFTTGYGLVMGNTDKKKGYAYIEWDTEESRKKMVKLFDHTSKEISDSIFKES